MPAEQQILELTKEQCMAPVFRLLSQTIALNCFRSQYFIQTKTSDTVFSN